MPPRRSTKGIPTSLRRLARRGERVRYDGFWMGETDSDRVIADWIEKQPRGTPTAIIKQLLFLYITGRLILGGSGDVYTQNSKGGAEEAAGEAVERLRGFLD